MFCSKCGKENRENAKFCISCGASLKQNVSGDKEPTQVPTAPPRLLSGVAAIVWVFSILTLLIVLALLIFDRESFGIEGVVIGVIAAIGVWWSHSKVMAHSRAHKAQTEVEIRTYTNQTPATQDRRFMNLLLDLAGVFAFSVVLGIILGFLGLTDLIEDTNETLLGYIFYLLYFMFFEGIWGKTPAKWFSKTKVVMFDGSKPPFANTMGRSLARLIPFEPFSFLSSKNPVGWHDKLSKTLVIND